MSDIKKILLGIVAVVVGLALLLSSGRGITPIIGVIIGVIGAAFIIYALVRSWF